MPRRSERVITIGVAGMGEVSEQLAREQLEDFAEAAENKDATIQFVFLATEEDFTDSIDSICDLAYKGNYSWVTVTDRESAQVKAIKELMQAGKSSTSHNPHLRFVQVLAAQPNPVFFCLYGNGGDEDEKTVQMAWDAHKTGIKCVDFADGMAPMLFGDEETTTTTEETDKLMTTTKAEVEELIGGLAEVFGDTRDKLTELLNGKISADEEVDEEEEEDEEEPAPRGRRRSRAAAVEDEEDEVDEEEEEEDEPPRARRSSKRANPSGNGRRTRGAKKAPPATRRSSSGNGRRTRGAAKRGARSR